MRKNILTNILLFLFIGGFVFAIVYFGNDYYKDKDDLQSHNKIVKGVVVKSKSFLTRGTKEIVITYRYEVNGKVYENTSSYADSLKQGDTCKVKYYIENPQNSTLLE